MRTPSRLAVVAAAGAALLAVGSPAFAVHESNNRLVFDAVGTSMATGSGTINYVKGASVEGDDERSVWQQSFSFSGLVAGAAYSIVVQRAEDTDDAADANGMTGALRPKSICDFTAAADGTGTCTGRFLELRALGNAQLQTGGTTVAQATRAPETAPGSISSQGGNREK